MEERIRLIKRLEQAHQTMLGILAEIDTQKEIYPGWTVKHVVAHITGWDELISAALRAHARGDDPVPSSGQSIDAYNAEFAAKAETLSYDQVLRQCGLARDLLKSAIDEVPAEKFDDRVPFPWGESTTIARIIAVLADHDLEHAEEIRGLLTDPAGAG